MVGTGIGATCEWIGIDPSLTGFAVCLLDKHGNYSIDVLKPKTRGVERLAEIDDYLHALLTDVERVHQVAIEGTVLRSPSASILGELSGVVKLRLYRYGYDPLVVPPMSLKKFVVGNARNTSKSQMLLSVYKRYGVELTDDNAADAYGLARIARGVWISKFEEEVLKKLANPKTRE